jgi:hypothetical protein
MCVGNRRRLNKTEDMYTEGIHLLSLSLGGAVCMDDMLEYLNHYNLLPVQLDSDMTVSKYYQHSYLKELKCSEIIN